MGYDFSDIVIVFLSFAHIKLIADLSCKYAINPTAPTSEYFCMNLIICTVDY